MTEPSINPTSDQPAVQEPIKQQPAPAPIDPGLIELVKIIKEGVIEYQQKGLEELKIEAKDRIYIGIAIVIAIVVIIVTIAILTYYGKFEISTLAFLLGTSVGSLLTILGKHLTGGE
jgi:hypothetical protein